MRFFPALMLCAALAARAAPSASPPSTLAPATSPPPAPLSGPQVIRLLDQCIDWYRTLGIQQQAANQPSDLLILYDNRQTASRVIALAFDIARADADILARQPADQNGAPKDATMQLLLQLQAKFESQGAGAQSELEGDRRQLGSASGNQAVELKAKIFELQGEIELINARKNLLATMLTIAIEGDTSGFSSASLKAQIDAMAINLPSATAGAVPQPAAASATGAAAPPAANNVA